MATKAALERRKNKNPAADKDMGNGKPTDVKKKAETKAKKKNPARPGPAKGIEKVYGRKGSKLSEAEQRRMKALRRRLGKNENLEGHEKRTLIQTNRQFLRRTTGAQRKKENKAGLTLNERNRLKNVGGADTFGQNTPPARYKALKERLSTTTHKQRVRQAQNKSRLAKVAPKNTGPAFPTTPKKKAMPRKAV